MEHFHLKPHIVSFQGQHKGEFNRPFYIDIKYSKRITNGKENLMIAAIQTRRGYEALYRHLPDQVMCLTFSYCCLNTNVIIRS